MRATVLVLFTLFGMGAATLAQVPAPETTPASPAGSAAAPESGPWSGGMEAVSVGAPDAVCSSGTSVDPPATGKSDRGQFFAVPIPRVDPALGTGLIGAGAYIFKLDRSDNETPPSIIGAGAFWMDSRSWGGGLGGKFYLGHDSLRLLTALAYADLKYDLTSVSETTGEEVTIPLSQEVYGWVGHAQFRVAKDIYVGARAAVGTVGMTPSEDKVPDVPESVKENLDGVFRLNSLGPSFALDTRDSAYYPRDGIALDASADIFFGAMGSDVTYESYTANYRQYAAIRGRDVLAWQVYLCATGGDPPFFLQCQVGPKSLLRGYTFGRYMGNAMAAIQAEYRWQVHPRWILAMFGGVTQVATRFGEFTSEGNLYAGGAGARFVVEPKNGVTLRVDYAWGKDESALYISVGEAF
jgi:hypothetical protein